MRGSLVVMWLSTGWAGGLAAQPPAQAQPLFLNQSQEAWLRSLQANDPTRRQAAAFALGYFNQVPEEVVTALVAALADADRHVREAAAQSLAELGPAAGDVAPQVLKHLQQEPDLAVARALMLALARLAPWSGPAAAELRKRTADPDPATRQVAVAALRALGKAAGVDSLPVLRRLAADPDEAVRLEAARAIGFIPLPAADAEGLLAPLLKSEDTLILVEAATLLGRLGSAGHALALGLRQRVESWPPADPRRQAVLAVLNRAELRRALPAPPETLGATELWDRWQRHGPELARRLKAEGILAAADERWLQALINDNDPRLRPALEELAAWQDVPHLARAARSRLGK